VKEEKKIQVIIGSHAHVPSGSPDSEFEFVYDHKIRPFVSNLYRYSNIQAVLHYSGVLLYWIERNHPEFFMLIEDMTARKQAELLGGGFYEPSFPLIPLPDRIGQIELMTTYLRKHFGKRPQGSWMPGLVWEQHLTAALSASDISYTFLSQEQFIQAGIKETDIFSPCLSEDQGKLVTIFPISTSVEKELGEKSFSQVFVDFKSKYERIFGSSNNDKIICVFPEKVSSSPEESPDMAWNRFFEEISLSKNIVETVLPSKIIKIFKTIKKASFPNSSALKDNFSPRRFLLENDGANSIYSKMIFTNVLINQLKGDKSRKLNAREELWKAQDSCLFSPGKGQYRNELRKSAYSSLLRAERLTRDKGKFISSLIQYDFDFDGIKEFLFQDAKINCYIQLKGAGIFELDYLPKDWNYIDCGSTETGCRMAFADIITSAENVINDTFSASGDNSRLCFNEQYESKAQERKGKSCFKLPSINEDIPFSRIEINKCYLLKRDGLTVTYVIRNTAKNSQKFQFIPEVDFSFAGLDDESVRFYTTDSNGKDTQIKNSFNADQLKIHDLKNEVQIQLSSAQNFSGALLQAFYLNLYQASRILPGFIISLEAGESWTNEFNLKFSH
jgi:hypothetical protein